MKHTATVLALAGLLAACGPNLTNGGNNNGFEGDGGIGDGAASDAQWVCSNNGECDSGICVGGGCCPTMEQVCGQNCCYAPSVCFASACVVPGDICFSTPDCAEGQYCEPGLGEGLDAGVPIVDAGTCIHEIPQAGRCLDLPPPCDGAIPDGGVCIPDCEYHPDPNGPLTAQVKWSWGPVADEFPDHTDVWATPAIGRVTDTNCDGVVNQLDPPNIIFVSGDANETCCSCDGSTTSTCLTGVLRVLDGLTGQEVWSLRRAEAASVGFAGLSVAIGDIDNDGAVDICTVTGEGYVVVIDAGGTLMGVSDLPIANHSSVSMFGWGGGLAVADMNGDGYPEIAYGNSVFTTVGAGISRLLVGAHGVGGNHLGAALSTFVDLDEAPDGNLELLAGNSAYRYDGSELWYRSDLGDGFSGVGDFDNDGHPEAVLVTGGNVYVLDRLTGATLLGPTPLGASGFGGPPTVADFDGDGIVEIGVAQANHYYVLKPDLAGGTLTELWAAPNHDFSSSVTGSTVFDFEGDGPAEVIYNDECFLWVYDGTTGNIRFATPTTSFTATEAALVADVDGDGHAEIVMISNGADPSAAGWDCDVAPWNQPDPNSVRPAWVPPPGGVAYRGITIFGDVANSWVGTRTLWNQHTYHVSNICDHRDDACDPPNVYGSIPMRERANWTVPWLNNFRQNVQDVGLFNAPDATITVVVDCTEPVVLRAWVRNLGAAILPAGVEVGFYVRRGPGLDDLLHTDVTTTMLFPGQSTELVYTTMALDDADAYDTFVAKIHVDSANPTFHECREDNNESPETIAVCVN